MTVEKAIELLTQTFVVKEEFVQDLIRDALRELGDIDLLITEHHQNQTNHIRDLYTHLNDLGDKIFNLEYENSSMKKRLCKLEGDER